MTNIDNETFRRLRERKGWTKTELGKRVGVSYQTILNIESGTYDPKLGLAARLARELDVTLDHLVDWSTL